MTNAIPQHGPLLEALGVRYRVWAPERRDVRIEITRAGSGTKETRKLSAAGDGFLELLDAEGRVGDLY